MREFIKRADDLTTELGVVINLCEWIDNQNDAELAAALPTLHSLMSTHLDALIENFNSWQRDRPSCCQCPHH